MAVLAPIPSASVSAAINVNPGFFNNILAPKRRSCRNVCIDSTSILGKRDTLIFYIQTVCHFNASLKPLIPWHQQENDAPDHFRSARFWDRDFPKTDSHGLVHLIQMQRMTRERRGQIDLGCPLRSRVILCVWIKCTNLDVPIYLKVTGEALGAHAAPRAGALISVFLLNNNGRPEYPHARPRAPPGTSQKFISLNIQWHPSGVAS